MPIRYNSQDNLFVYGQHPIESIMKGKDKNNVIIGTLSFIHIPKLSSTQFENIQLCIYDTVKRKSHYINIPTDFEQDIFIMRPSRLSIIYDIIPDNNDMYYDIVIKNEQGIEIQDKIIRNETLALETQGPKKIVAKYNYNTQNKTASLTEILDKNIDTLNIPASVSYKGEEYKVTTLQTNSITFLPKLINLTLPHSIEKIEDKAIHHCLKIKRIFMENNNFYKCDNNRLMTTDGKILIKATKLVKDIPNTIEEIASYGLENYQQRIFYYPNIRILRESVFHNAKTETIVLPDKTTTIGSHAFEECINLYSLYLPATLQTVGAQILPKSDKILVYLLNKNQIRWDTHWHNNINNSQLIEHAVLDTTIGPWVFVPKENNCEIGCYYGNQSIINLPQSFQNKTITRIKKYSCYNSNITKINNTNNITYIEEYAFDNTPVVNYFNDLILYIGKVVYKIKDNFSNSMIINIEPNAVSIASNAGITSTYPICLMIKNNILICDHAFKNNITTCTEKGYQITWENKDTTRSIQKDIINYDKNKEITYNIVNAPAPDRYTPPLTEEVITNQPLSLLRHPYFWHTSDNGIQKAVTGIKNIKNNIRYNMDDFYYSDTEKDIVLEYIMEPIDGTTPQKAYSAEYPLLNIIPTTKKIYGRFKTSDSGILELVIEIKKHDTQEIVAIENNNISIYTQINSWRFPVLYSDILLGTKEKYHPGILLSYGADILIEIDFSQLDCSVPYDINFKNISEAH